MAKVMDVSSQKETSKPKRQFYRRELPTSCIAFSSEKGKQVFQEALTAGYANIYFRLAEQFHTQAEPAYCGISTLVMVLNSLAVDPQRIWRGGWRWYSEDMLDCCLPLDAIKKKGITMEEYICTASCNNLDVKVVRMTEHDTIRQFREVVKRTCQGDRKVLTCSYSRKSFGQTGDGHFSPIGAYHPGEDLILIFDVARFKYPPHWVSVQMMWEAMKMLDSVTKKPRGYVVFKKTEETPLILFRLSTTFRVTVGTKNFLHSRMAQFLVTWNTFLNTTITKAVCSLVCSNVRETVEHVLNALNSALSLLLEEESIFTTSYNMCCVEKLAEELVSDTKLLLKSLEDTDVYKNVSKWLTTYLENEEKGIPERAKQKGCKKKRCCCLNRIGKPVADIEEVVGMRDKPCLDDLSHQSQQCAEKQKQRLSSCEHEPKDEQKIISDCHYITLLLLSWPYQPEDKSTYSFCLSEFTQKSLKCTDDILKNEVKTLRHQIESLINYVQQSI